MKTHPFRLFALLAGFFLLTSANVHAAQAAKPGEKYTFVVVHGATAGAWEWKSTGKYLTDDGHTVYRATLTGLGEREHLNSPDVDLLIRTGGEQRLSDFLLWECAYAELLFTQCLWPDFGPRELESAVAEFRRRERRFGNWREPARKKFVGGRRTARPDVPGRAV